MRLLFLGELDIHACALIPFLRNRGYDIEVVNTSHWVFPESVHGTDIPVYNLYRNGAILRLFKGRLGWLRKPVFYTIAEKAGLVTEGIRRAFEGKEIDIIYGSWGSQCLPEFRSMRRFGLPMVYEFLTYPTRTSNLAVRIENTVNKVAIEGCSGRILATKKMSDYMRRFLDMRHGENLVFTECYPESYFCKKRLPLLSEQDGQHHLIFNGMDVHNVSPQINEITRRKIHVHLHDAEDAFGSRNIQRNEYLHMFRKFGQRELADGTLSTFMTQFDACLCTYDFSRSSNLDRFHNSVPNRFSFALTAGIPIVMPGGYLRGCEDIVEDHKIGFTYANCDDLRNKLNDENLMSLVRRNGLSKSKRFTLENNFATIDGFLKKTHERHQNDAHQSW